MELQTNIIIYFIKTYVMNVLVYYCYIKILNLTNSKTKIIFLTAIINFILTIICTYVKFFINSFIAVILMCFMYSVVLGKIVKNRLGYSLIVTMISYAICAISIILSSILAYIPYKIFYILLHTENYTINTLIVLAMQSMFVFLFFKIKRFKKGFQFLNNKFNNDLTDIIITNISIFVILVYCMMGTIFDEITRNLLITFVILSVTMIVTIQKMLTMYYKQKLLNDTLQHYEQEIKSKDAELEKLKAEKFNISKITHEFYNRQKALELLVKNNVSNNENNVEEKASPNVLRIIKSLTEEYSSELTNFKELPKLETTEIPEIDNMFKYMQNECAKNNIEFKLKVVGNIFPLINNIISKNKLETLIGDHLRDAINAVKASNTENKEILAILGIKDNKYELSIHDTGIDFKIDTLLKLGLEAVTTNKENGGSGIGFLTTFETMKQTKASLIITEFPPNKDRYYTKSVTIRFDGENKYKICSHRADKIEEYNESKRIIVEKT